ncbi:mRNA cleavage and polyadenylation factor I complex, subunit RNA14 [Trachipleistophora hominis]|uniref:mRNA cleavage and polyadenylation factor I complex, subunit RNA14 n=1 Tax=Trachipleistophora hominis TaxID=72359 RepID=L7JYH8_TRAHO|nr:mRNA cleavage and polyadenylation factor I complex, subunit RNA14 [Trachipleistophora hominis]
MFYSPIYEHAKWLYRTSKLSKLDDFLKTHLSMSYNVYLWQLYLAHVFQNMPEKLLDAYEYALSHLEGHFDITLILRDYLCLIDSMHDQDVVDRKRAAYQNVIKYAVFCLPAIYKEYEEFEYKLNKFTAKTILEKVSYNYKGHKRLSLTFNANKEIMDQVTLENYSALFEVDERKIFVWKCLKEKFYYSEEIYFELIRMAPNFVVEAIFCNSFVDHDEHSNTECILQNRENTFTRANFFFVLLGAYLNKIDLASYIFKENFLSNWKIGEGDSRPDTAKIAAIGDLKDSFRGIRIRNKDLVYIHFLDTVFKNKGISAFRCVFRDLKDLIGPLVFYYVAQLEYYVYGDVNVFVNVMLLGSKKSRSLETYMIKFLVNHRQENLARKYAAYFGRREALRQYLYLYTFEPQSAENENATRTESLNDFYYKGGFEYEPFILRSKGNKAFNEMVKTLEFEELRLYKHSLLLEMMEDVRKDESIKLFEVVHPECVVKLLRTAEIRPKNTF